MNVNEILRKAIQTYGEEAQEKVAIEECSELIQAICHQFSKLIEKLKKLVGEDNG